MDSVVLAWDADVLIRDRVRDMGRLMLMDEGKAGLSVPMPGTLIPKTVATARANKPILMHVLAFISTTDGLKMPNIDMVLDAVGSIYKKNRVEITSDLRYQDSWGIRRLCQLVKSRLYKKTPPKD